MICPRCAMKASGNICPNCGARVASRTGARGKPSQGTEDFYTLQDLATPDRRALLHGPLGLGESGLSDEDSCEWLQSMIAAALLAPDVPDELQRSFERLRTLHAYGVLCYDTFTAVDEDAPLILEQALRARFVTFYEGRVPTADKADHAATFLADEFEEVYTAFRRGGDPGTGWHLRLQAGGTFPCIPTTLRPLLDWARAEQLLDGRRSRVVEAVLGRLRNMVAHRDGFHLVGPHDSAIAVCDLAEIINRLWGHHTPGGRLYPGPIAREVFVVAWRDGEHGFEFARLRPEQLDRLADDEAWTCVVLRAVPSDVLWPFDGRFESTMHPCDRLWGPGDPGEAAAWIESERPTGDEVRYIDRLFAVQVAGGTSRPPRRPAVALGLPDKEREGDWYLLRADDPSAALAYVRRATGEVVLREDDTFTIMPVEEVAHGSWEDVAEQLPGLGVTQAESPKEIKVPR